MKYIDLFAGVGGFHYGIKNKGQCVYANEWDKYANSVYRRHFGKCDQRDITTVASSEIPDHDLLCAGFPCQSFSIAGKRGGFEDTRGTLFFEIARIASHKRPRYLLLENVKGLLSHDKGKTFSTMLGVLSDLGYRVEWQVFNSKHFGVPQNRERVFIVGHLRGECRRQIFPLREGNGKDVSSKRKKDKPKVFMLGEHRTELGKKTRREIRKKEGRDSTLRGKDHKEYRPTTVEEANCLTTGKENVEKWLIDLSTQEAKVTKNARSLQARYWKGYSHRKAETSGVLDGMKIRRLTPVECERLQGFPDNWTKYGADGETISDTQRYKMMGNAVTTNVITAIITQLFKEDV